MRKGRRRCRGVGLHELLQDAFHVCGINSKVVPLIRFHKGSSPSPQESYRFRHLLALDRQVSVQFSDDFSDDLVRSSQQQVVHVEYE